MKVVHDIAGETIYNVESLAIKFKDNVRFKQIHFDLTESTDLNADGDIFFKTLPRKVNQWITLEQLDKYVVVTVVDLHNVQTSHRFNNDDIQDLSWSVTIQNKKEN